MAASECAGCTAGRSGGALTERKPLPERTVVLTFDDGYSDFYFSAAPVLRRLKLPATIFVPTGLCGGANRSPGPSGWISPQPLLDWDQVAALAKEGFSFGAHSISHPALPALSAEEAKHEIAGSKTELQERTGQKVEFFAYPYGRWSPAVRAVVQEEYRGACSTGAGVVEPDADPFALPRVDVHYLRRPRPSECCLPRLFWPMWRPGVSSGESVISRRVFMLEFSRSAIARPAMSEGRNVKLRGRMTGSDAAN